MSNEVDPVYSIYDRLLGLYRKQAEIKMNDQSSFNFLFSVL